LGGNRIDLCFGLDGQLTFEWCDLKLFWMSHKIWIFNFLKILQNLNKLRIFWIFYILRKFWIKLSKKIKILQKILHNPQNRSLRQAIILYHIKLN